MPEKILIVGLGNPGAKYSDTRHNIGRMIVGQLIKTIETAPTIILSNCGDRYYMNESGQWVADYFRNSNFDKENLVVLHDDLDLPFGSIRVRFGGSSAGHNGIQSIIDSIGSDQFWRIRIGIGRPPLNLTPEKFVLQKFTPAESRLLPKIIDQAGRIVLELVANQKLQEKTIAIKNI